MSKMFDNTEELKASTKGESFEEQKQPVVSAESEASKGQEVPPEGEVTETKKRQWAGPKKTIRNKARRNVKEDDNNPESIGPKSPSIYLLKGEKQFLDRLKAFILLETGEKTTDHELVMKALMEYANRNHKEFVSKI